MELHQLRSVLRVSEEGSITRAAEVLCLTQPAVTQHIQALERELDVRLFDRTARGVRLTQAGQILCEHAKRSLGILEECRQAIADLESGRTGRLIIGAGVTTSIFDLPQWLDAFRAKYPGVDMVVRTGRSKEVAKLVLDREVDLGLVTSPIEDADLQVRCLLDEDFILVASPRDPIEGGEISLQELGQAPLIIFPRPSSFRDNLDSILARAGISPQVKMEMDSVEAIKCFVQVGLGVSFLPRSAVMLEIEAGTMIPVQVEGLPPLVRTTWAIYRTDRYLSVAAKEFLAILTG